MTGWLSAWSVSRMRRMSQEMTLSSSSRDRDVAEMWCPGSVFSSRLLRVTLGEAGVAGELNLEQSSPDRDLQNLARQQSPGLGEFLTKNTKHLSQIASCWVYFYFARLLKLLCGSWMSHWYWPLRNNAANYKRICPEMFRECLIWDVLRCIGRSNASIARTKLSVTHNFDELLKLSQQQWH